MTTRYRIHAGTVAAMIAVGLALCACGGTTTTPDIGDAGDVAQDVQTPEDLATDGASTDAEDASHEVITPAADVKVWGPYAVGYRTFETNDTARADRPVPIIAYYPTAGAPVTAAAETQCSFETSGLPSEFAVLDAEPLAASGGYPVLIFSHGSGGQKEMYKYLLEFVASHGFVVVAMDHTGNVGLAASMPDDMDMTSQRVRDVLYAIGWVETVTAQEGHPLAGMLDVERIALAGHSWGGHPVLAIAGATWDFDHLAEICNVEDPVDPYACSLLNHKDIWDTAIPSPRVKAVISLAHDASEVHFGIGCAGASGLEVPSMYVGGTVDTMADFATNAQICFDRTGVPSYLVKLIQGGHIGFTDVMNDGTMSCARMHQLVRGFSVAFLNRWLKGLDSSDAALSGDAASWTETSDFEVSAHL